MALKRVLLSFALIISLATVFAQEGDHRYEYLVDAANELFDIQLDNVDLNADQMLKITATSCVAMRRLQKDSNFPKDLDRLYKQLDDYQRTHRALRDDLTQFMDAFLLPETAALKSAGLTDTAISHISAAIGYVHGALGERTDPTLILNAIEGLTEEVCTANAKLKRDKEVEKDKTERRRTVMRWTMGIGGAAVLVADALGTAPSVGVATASYQIGGAILTGTILNVVESE